MFPEGTVPCTRLQCLTRLFGEYQSRASWRYRLSDRHKGPVMRPKKESFIHWENIVCFPQNLKSGIDNLPVRDQIKPVPNLCSGLTGFIRIQVIVTFLIRAQATRRFHCFRDIFLFLESEVYFSDQRMNRNSLKNLRRRSERTALSYSTSTFTCPRQERLTRTSRTTQLLSESSTCCKEVAFVLYFQMPLTNWWTDRKNNKTSAPPNNHGGCRGFAFPLILSGSISLAAAVSLETTRKASGCMFDNPALTRLGACD